MLRDEIRAHTRTNVIQEKKYSDRLLEALRNYHNRAIETAQVIEELIAMAKDFEKDLKKGEELGLNPDELAFYMALIENESAVRELSDETLKKLAVELTEKLRRSTTVDWQVRESDAAPLDLFPHTGWAVVVDTIRIDRRGRHRPWVAGRKDRDRRRRHARPHRADGASRSPSADGCSSGQQRQSQT